MQGTTTTRRPPPFRIPAAPPAAPRGARLLLVMLTLCAAVAATAAPAWAGPILFEVCYDGSGSDADDVFTEIYGQPGTNLNGWSLVGINGTTGSAYRTVSLTGMSIPNDGLLVLATSSATGSVLAARDYAANVDWQNGPDAVLLLDANQQTVDALQYGTYNGWSAGEGNAATDVSAGWSLSRDAWATDTGDNATDFVGLSTPTPGVGPSFAPVPEPGSFALLLAGGGAYVGFRRRVRKGRAR